MMEQRPFSEVPSANDIVERANQLRATKTDRRDALLTQFLAYDHAPESCDCPSDEYVEDQFVSDEQHRRWHAFLAGTNAALTAVSHVEHSVPTTSTTDA